MKALKLILDFLNIIFAPKIIKNKSIDLEPQIMPKISAKLKFEITLNDYLTASGKYPNRAKSGELTEEYLDNAYKLIGTVNTFLKELGLNGPFEVSSGFRPTEVNAKIKNAAAKSLHTRCLAIDLVDLDGKIDAAIMKRPDLLKKYNLWLEHPNHTPKWAHLDLGTRRDREIQVFIP